VTVIAWIFILLAGFATLIAILQNIMIALIFPVAEMQAAATQAKNQPGVPWFASWMFSHFQVFFLLFLVVSASTLTASIGLLKRRNWARLLFVTLMALGILWNIAGLVLMFFFFSSFSDVVPANQQAADHFDVMVKIMFAVNGLMVVAFIWLFGWIIKRLVSEDIRREFSAV
jgi:hypothetical protein